MTSLISDVYNIMRDSSTCKTTHARASQAQLNATLCSEIGMEEIDRLCCRHDGTHEQPRSTSVHSAEVSQLHGYQQCSSFSGWSHPSRSSSPWHPSHSGSNHASQSSPVDLKRHANACFCPSPTRSGICLSNDVRRSNVCAFVPMSAQFSNVSTDTNWNSFLRYDSCIHNSLIERCRTFPDPVLMHIPRAALLSDAMVTSRP